MSRYRILYTVLAVVALVTILPDTAFAAQTCKVERASTPEARAGLWGEALESFSAARPDLSPEQARWVADAVSLRSDIATLPEDEGARAAFARKVTHFMERAHELFSNNELGPLFTDMGETQLWLAQLAAAYPYCNCVGTGECQLSPPSGPKGDCKSGCISWDGNGTRWDGICTVPATPVPSTPTTPQ